MKALKKLSLFFGITFVSTLLMATFVMAAPVPDENYILILNGEKVVFDQKTPPIIENGSTLLPLRFLFNLINNDGSGSIDWVDETKEITISYGGKEVKLWIGNKTATINGVESEINGAAPVIYNDSTYVPLRFLANTFDMTVNWDTGSRTASAIDNAILDKIVDIMENTNNYDIENVKLSADFDFDMSLAISAGGETENIDMNMSGTIEQALSTKFQHIIMNAELLGETVTLELYDDGEWMYMIIDGEAVKTSSSMEFMDLDSIMSQANQTTDLSVLREMYTTFDLQDTGENYVLSGTIFIPEDFFADSLSSLDSIEGIEGMEGMEELLGDLTIKMDGINCEYVINKATGAIVSVDIQLNMEMSMEIEGEKISFSLRMDMNISDINMNANFDAVVPKSIKDSAIEI